MRRSAAIFSAIASVRRLLEPCLAGEAAGSAALELVPAALAGRISVMEVVVEEPVRVVAFVVSCGRGEKSHVAHKHFGKGRGLSRSASSTSQVIQRCTRET